MKSYLSNLHPKLTKRLALALTVFCGVHLVHAHPEPAACYEGQVEPHRGENFGFAQYCCWVPAGSHTVNGVLCVVLHPHGNTGVKFKDPEPWIDLAEHHQCALLSLSFVDAADKTRNWSYAFEGSGRALIAALDEVAAASGVVELAKSRIVIAGICQAGQFAYGFSTYAPDRVAAFVTMGGSLHQVSLAWRAADVPGLLVAALDRGQPALDNMFSLFTEGRKYFALWNFSLEQIQDYDRGHSSALVESFLDTALARLRQLPTVALSTNPTTIPYAGMTLPFRKVASNDRFEEPAPLCIDDSTTDWLQLWGMAVKQYFANLGLSFSALSFVSVPLPALGHGPERVDLGTIHLADGVPEQITASLPVCADERSTVDGVAVASCQDGFSWHADSLGVSKWDIKCNFDLSFVPSGSFVMSVPVRFLLGDKVKPGGFTTLIRGTVIRDISAVPSVINFGKIDATGQSIHLRLKSASGAAIQVLGIESSLPDRAKAKITSVNDGSVVVDCCLDVSTNMPKAFSGYYLLRVKSDHEQTLRVMFYGQNF